MLYIHSPSEFDLRSLTILGLSAKESTNPIGMFGTGLKYSIATLMRNGLPPVLLIDGARYTFELRKINFRSSESEVIVLVHPDGGETELPFNTNYGRNWLLWQVYRELVSNAYDEGGGVSRFPVEARVVFQVQGLDEVRHNEVFLDKGAALLGRTSDIEVYQNPTNFIYYRGIRAKVLPFTCPFTVNIIAKQDLSEERELPSLYFFWSALSQWIFSEASAEVHELLLTLTKEVRSEFFRLITFLRYLESTPSPAFLKAAEDVRAPFVYREYLQRKKSLRQEYAEIEPTALELLTLRQALTLVKVLFPQAELEDFILTDELDEDTAGCYVPRTGNLFISTTSLRQGVAHVAATMIEEYTHKYKKHHDGTRAMQEFLLQALVNQIAERIIK